MGALIGANGTAPNALRAKTEAGTFPGLAPGAEEELSLSEESSPEPEESSAYPRYPIRRMSHCCQFPLRYCLRRGQPSQPLHNSPEKSSGPTCFGDGFEDKFTVRKRCLREIIGVTGKKTIFHRQSNLLGVNPSVPSIACV